MKDMKKSYKKKVIIGDITLYLGDCLEVMPTLEYDSIVTDPPFGMNFLSNHRAQKHKSIANDANEDFLLWACELDAPHSKYIFCRWNNLNALPEPKSCITWVKNNWSMGDLEHEHARQTEICLFYKGDKHSFPRGRPSDVVDVRRTGNSHHPTEKPVDLMRIVVGWTRGTVVDPFMGSGTTLVACAKMGRKGIGIELDEDYFNIACKRVEDAYKSPDMFVEAAKKEIKQEVLI